MSRICAVCLSDLHLGSETSVLTAVNQKTLEPNIDETSAVLDSLVKCLKEILSVHTGDTKPTLVLAGDVLELALATTDVATSVFAQFIDLLFNHGDPVVNTTIVYVPGNHDHHLWEMARERQYLSYVREPDTDIPLKNPPWHTTYLFCWREELGMENRDVGSVLLTTVANKVAPSKNICVQAMYPNFAVLSADGKSRCTVVHHGHFTESIYYLMTELRKIVFPEREGPDEIWDVESENYAWIDFLWGTMGRSGEVGKDMELVYNILRSKKATRRLIRKLARSVPKRFKHPWWTWWFEIPLIWLVLTLLVNRFRKLERTAPDSPLSKKSKKLLKEYIGQYVLGQLHRECNLCWLPEQLTFVFGHTHKPYETVLKDVPGLEAEVHIYNMGGWVIDTIPTAPRQGGAIVVIDEDGYATSIRMYNQSDDPTSYQVKLARADSEAGGDNQLYRELDDLINPKIPPWSNFSGEVEKAVKIRRQNLKEIVRRVE